MGRDPGRMDKVIYFCAGGACARNGAAALVRDARAFLKTEGFHGSTHTVKTLCAGQCEHGPIVAVQPDNAWYERMDAGRWERVVREHLGEGRPVEDCLLQQPSTGGPAAPARCVAFAPELLPPWGAVRTASLDPWESNLYPLLRDLFVNRYAGLAFEAPALGEERWTLVRPAEMDYDGVRARIAVERGRLDFVIGVLNEKNPDHARVWNERITEVRFVETHTPGPGPDANGRGPLRVLIAGTRRGERILSVRFPGPAGGHDPWDHFTRIHLERA